MVLLMSIVAVECRRGCCFLRVLQPLTASGVVSGEVLHQGVAQIELLCLFGGEILAHIPGMHARLFVF